MTTAREFQRYFQQWEAMDNERRKTAVKQQVSDGRVNLIPMPRVATQPFRTELYTDSLPIFVADSFRGESRFLEWSREHPESGEPVIERLWIGRTSDTAKERGLLRQRHQRVWFHLLKLWNDLGYPLVNGDNKGEAYGQIKISARTGTRLLSP